MWQSFLEDVSSGKAKDPLGQYVSKETKVVFNGTGPRPTRPKYNDYQRQLKAGPNGGVITNLTQQPVDPCDICGGYTPPPPVFVSTEGQAPYNGVDNPNGYIYDLKLISNSGVIPNTPPGYTRLDIDLNDQAGGHYIFLTFVREPLKVKYGREYYQGLPYAAGPVTNIDIKTGGSNPPRNTQYYYNIWNYSDYGYNYYGPEDLNDGAGGAYIWSYQTKQPGTPIEIGILSGDNDRIQPPAGWNKFPTDLNQSAGGKFIYLCIKSR